MVAGYRTETRGRSVEREHNPGTRGALLADVNLIEWRSLGEDVSGPKTLVGSN